MIKIISSKSLKITTGLEKFEQKESWYTFKVMTEENAKKKETNCLFL